MPPPGRGPTIATMTTTSWTPPSVAPSPSDNDALGDLAVVAEQSADAVIDTDRPPGARASQPPTAAARAVSWRLHGLAHALHASREICQAAQGASRELARARQAHRGSALTGMHVHRQLLGPSR